jgi:hypothetical protein
MKRILLPIVILAALTSACESEITNYNNRVYTPQLVLNAQFEQDADTHYVSVHLSRRDDIATVDDATVTLAIDDGAAIAATPCGDGRYALVAPFTPGQHLRLDALSADGTLHARAETVVTQPVAALSVDTLTRHYMGNPTLREVNVTLTDRAGEPNYYRLDIRHDLTLYIPTVEAPTTMDEYNIEHVIYHDFYTDEEPVLNDGRLPTTNNNELEEFFPSTAVDNRYHLFPDTYFPDRSYTLHCTAPLRENFGHFAYVDPDTDTYVTVEPHGIEATMTVRLLSLSADYYRYLRLLTVMQGENYDSALMEPVILPTNVTGGLGFVTAAAVSTVRFQLKSAFGQLPTK